MKKLFTAGLIATLAFGTLNPAVAKTSKAQNQQFAVYYVDMQRIVNESAKGKQAKSLLEAKIAKARRKIESLQKEIEKIKKDLSSPVLSKEAKEQKETELQQKIREFRRFQQDAQIEIANLEKKYTYEIINEAVKVIKNYQKDHRIPMIIEAREAGIIAADPRYDLTEKIIKLYDQQAGK